MVFSAALVTVSAVGFHLGGLRSNRSPRSADAAMAGITHGKVHGEGGAYVGGFW
eukprot:CAMPEP_0119074956 /NCGR_PEP_ID=MMETSP1178-20130426/75422_1 /TAXON_ID=33656 /ORGANISM="unid sp, Strain CCMP2000" /LENGTH=53 /DNA_ID=CAMNT_0007057147 /DNA_START=25 /DNA_END=183 /DNA_ORIENTATION=+